MTGTAIRMAREYGVPAPINETLYGILKPWALRIEQELARSSAISPAAEPVVLGPKENYID